jgi:hypothetical protein
MNFLLKVELISLKDRRRRIEIGCNRRKYSRYFRSVYKAAEKSDMVYSHKHGFSACLHALDHRGELVRPLVRIARVRAKSFITTEVNMDIMCINNKYV